MGLKCFGTKNLQDKRNIRGENEITGLFLASAGCEAIMKILVMAYPKDLEELTFEDLKQIIRNNLRPKKKLVITERTKFLSNKQNSNKLARFYLHRLKEASKFCEFEKLGTENITIEEELIQLCFIEELHNVNQRNKILRHLQGHNMTLEACIEFLQQLEMTSDFSETTHNNAVVFQVEETVQCGTGMS